MDSNESTASKRPTWLLIGGFALVVVLILVGLFLPPISLGQRLGWGSGASTQSASTADADFESGSSGAPTSSLPEGVAMSLGSGSASIAVATVDEFMAGKDALPAHLRPVGDVYVVSYDGDAPRGQVALPVPPEASTNQALDLYGWQGDAWRFLPSQIDSASGQVVSGEVSLPQALALMDLGAPQQVAAGAEVASDEGLAAPLLPLLGEVTVGSLLLNSDGSLSGEVTPLPQGAYEQWVRVTNVGPVIDQAAVSTLLGDPSLQQAHIAELASKAAEGGFSGINLDYQNVPAGQAEAFSTFVRALAETLHAENLKLALTLSTPAIAGANWDTGGQDWPALGEHADVIYVQLPLDPTEYDTGDTASQLLQWATRQVDRTKLSALYSATAVDRVGDSYAPLSNQVALANFGELEFMQGGETVAPNEVVEVALSGTASPLEWDGESLTYRYTYEQDGELHEVWLGSEAALSHRLQQAQNLNLRGISVRGLGDVSNGEGYAAALGSYLGTAEAPQPTGAAIVWTVRNGDDSVLASESGNELTFSWNVGESEGEYVVRADFALGDNIAPLDTLDVSVNSAVAEAEGAEGGEEGEAVAEAEEVTATPEAEATVEAAATPAPTATFSGEADAVVAVGANIRLGPGLTYGTLANGADPGTELRLIGRNQDATWLNVVLPDGQEGWIFANLLTLNPSVSVNDLEVVEVAPAVAGQASDPEASGANEPAPAAAPPPVAAAPVSNPGFELGGQSHSFANPTLMSYAGMNWVKFQHKWGPGDDPSAVAGRIQQAHANGFKVLLSIPGATTYPSEIDFNSYVEFLRGVAALGPDAIEVWNEMNIDFEWPAGQINPTSYVNNMLAPAYNAIKSANPSVMVISGAPAPTGFFGGGCGNNGCDDNAYLAGMAAAGAASYMDCIGVHHNAGATPPSQSSGHPAGGGHYSWYFQPTLDLYYGAFGKPVCFTELGYLSGEDFGGVPSRFSWAGNTSVAEHAQWLAEAVSLAANSGKTRLAIIFNVDFTQWGEDPQAGFAMIRPDGGCPACETLRQVMGR